MTKIKRPRWNLAVSRVGTLKKIHFLLKMLYFFYGQLCGSGEQICVQLMHLLTNRIEFAFKPEFGTNHSSMDGNKWAYETDKAQQNKRDKQTLEC